MPLRVARTIFGAGRLFPRPIPSDSGTRGACTLLCANMKRAFSWWCTYLCILLLMCTPRWLGTQRWGGPVHFRRWCICMKTAGVVGDQKCFRGAVAVGFVFAVVDLPSGLAGGGLDIRCGEGCDGFPEPTIQSPHNTRPPGTKPREVPSPYPGGKGEFLFSGRWKYGRYLRICCCGCYAPV